MATDIQAEVNRLLLEYGDAATDCLKDVCIAVGEEAKAKVRAASPSNPHSKGKKYRTGWRVKKRKDSRSVEVRVYNANKPGLTHLLEKGHATRNGGHVAGQAHIGPVNESAQETVVQELERRLSKL